MTDEAAKELADAMNRLATAIESVRGQGLMGGIQVHHHGYPATISPQVWPPSHPYYGPNWSYTSNTQGAQ